MLFLFAVWFEYSPGNFKSTSLKPSADYSVLMFRRDETDLTIFLQYQLCPRKVVAVWLVYSGWYASSTGLHTSILVGTPSEILSLISQNCFTVFCQSAALRDFGVLTLSGHVFRQPKQFPYCNSHCRFNGVKLPPLWHTKRFILSESLPDRMRTSQVHPAPPCKLLSTGTRCPLMPNPPAPHTLGNMYRLNLEPRYGPSRPCTCYRCSPYSPVAGLWTPSPVVSPVLFAIPGPRGGLHSSRALVRRGWVPPMLTR